jgi:hypothetical protein
MPDIPDIPPMPDIPDMPPIPDIPDMPPIPPIPDMPYMLADAKGATASTVVRPKALINPFTLGIRKFFILYSSKVDFIIEPQIETIFHVSSNYVSWITKVLNNRDGHY